MYPSGLVQRVSLGAEDGEGNPVVRPTEYTYDDEGRVATINRGPARKLRISYDSSGGLKEVVNESANVVLVTYENDAVQRPIRIKLRDDKLVQVNYDDNSNVTGVMTPSMAPHEMDYSWLGQLLSYTPPATDSEPAESFRTRYEYDADYQLRSMTAADGRQVVLGYDNYGRLASITGAGRDVSLTYTQGTGGVRTATRAQGEEITHLYDGALPQMDVWTGPVSATVSWGYNNRFLLETETVAGFGAVAYDYDLDELLTSVGPMVITRDPMLGRIDAIGIGDLVERIGYNEYGEVTSRHLNKGQDSLYAASYTPDVLGRMELLTESVQGGTLRTTTYGYHVRGWLNSVAVQGQSNPTTFSYDDNGNRQDPDAEYDEQDRMIRHGADTFTYSASGELVTKTTSEAGQPPKVTTFDYDMLGNLHTVQQPDGTVITYEVDAYDRRIQKSVNGTVI